jgi:Flp pilus assembly pilin Flp
MTLLCRLLAQDDGQDLVEYALLTAAAGFVALATFALLSDNINSAYSSWDTGVNGLWEVPDPE